MRTPCCPGAQNGIVHEHGVPCCWACGDTGDIIAASYDGCWLRLCGECRETAMAVIADSPADLPVHMLLHLVTRIAACGEGPAWT